MTVQFPLDVLYNGDNHTVTFIRSEGQNSAESLLKYLEEEFPFAPAIELLKVVVPDLNDVPDVDQLLFLTEENRHRNIGHITMGIDFWDRVDRFRGEYRRWVKEVASSKHRFTS